MTRRAPTRVDLPDAHKARPPVWRSLEDKHRSADERRKLAETEFAEGQTSGLVDASSLVSRRGFLKTSTVSAAAAGLAACIRRPEEHILPYGKAPEHVVPGVPLHFATVTERRGDAIGLLVTSHEGRPTKVEGNPKHPGSQGGTDVFAQAMLMDLYDPDRARRPSRAEAEARADATWAEFLDAYRARLGEHDDDGGTRLRFLLQPTTSMVTERALETVARRFPNAQVHHYAPISNDNLFEGTRIAFGSPSFPFYDYQNAQVILALDHDFLGSEAGAVRSAKRFAAGRALESAEQADSMSRLYAVESGFTITGASADHRLPLAAQDVGKFLRLLAKDLVENFGVALAEPVRAALGQPSLEGLDSKWLSSEHEGSRVGLAADLAQHRGRAMVTVGSRQPAWVHALAHAVNEGLGALNGRVALAPAHGPLGSTQSIAELTDAMRAGQVDTLVVLGGNPVHDAPADIEFNAALAEVGEVFCLSSHVHETAARSHWHCPEAHELESWGDAVTLEGTVAIRQPLIRPMWHGARTAAELLAIAGNVRGWRGYQVLRQVFRDRFGDREQGWHTSLRDGVVPGTLERPRPTVLQADAVAGALGAVTEAETLGPDRLELNFVPCGKLFDGRYANNIWLQELPDAMTKIVWDNAALVSPRTATELGISDGDVVRLTRESRAVERVAAFVLPGLPDWTVTMSLGHGRGAAGGRYAHRETDVLGAKAEDYGGGFNAYPLRTSGGMWFAAGVELSRTSERYNVVRTQEHGLMSGLSHAEPRPLVIDATVAEYQATPEFTQYRAVDMTHADPKNPDAPPPGGPLWEPVDYSEGHKWGMVIDLTKCTGCNACVVACQAENNVPCVGKRQVARGREMYWLRLDRYFVGDDMMNPQIAVQPVACQHCEEAPCENVCPVNATVHSPEGLNEMAYNRCIGTRYCANNCPYKVRRFNYLSWHGYVDNRLASYGDDDEPMSMAHNPNVTVRMRGVMEKCTYCVQRIMEAKFEAKRGPYHDPTNDYSDSPRDERALAEVRRMFREGERKSACQQVCPSDAISFGDLNDRDSEVARRSEVDRHYQLLAEVGTRPRTTFLGQIRNPNPDMVADPAASHPDDAHHAEEHG